MKLFITVVLVIAFSLGVVYLMTGGSPQPDKYVISHALEEYMDYKPMQWDWKFGRETTNAEGIPAWPVTYHVTTSSPGKGKEIKMFTLLFWKDGYNWKTAEL